MKNDYEIRGPVTIIYCKMPENLGGEIKEVKINTDKLELVQAWPGTWYIRQSYTGEMYVIGTKIITLIDGYSSTQPRMCRVIAETPPGSGVIFDDADPFNCMTENLINIKLGWNYDESEKQPVKGVHWRTDKQRWEAQPFSNSKRYNLGMWPWDKLPEANAAVTEFRALGPKAYFEIHPQKEVINYYKDSLY